MKNVRELSGKKVKSSCANHELNAIEIKGGKKWKSIRKSFCLCFDIIAKLIIYVREIQERCRLGKFMCESFLQHICVNMKEIIVVMLSLFWHNKKHLVKEQTMLIALGKRED